MEKEKLMDEEFSNWRKLEDEIPYAYDRYVVTLPDGKDFEVAVHPVAFGSRVIGMYSKSRMALEFSWCCGANPAIITLTQRLIMKLINNGTPISDIPNGSTVKPWTSDSQFVDQINNLPKHPLGDWLMGFPKTKRLY